MTIDPIAAPVLAVDYLAAPGTRHDPPARIGEALADDLDRLHARCSLAWAGPIDVGAALVQVTAAGRQAFVGSQARSVSMLDADLVDAVVHAARAGYLLCLRRDPGNGTGYRCWLPTGHSGGCELRGWWRWTLLYGYRGPVTVVCGTCTPRYRRAAPVDCPHGAS